MKKEDPYRPPHPIDAKNKIAKLISSWFFIGFSPCAPGTIGTLAGLPISFLLAQFKIGISFFLLVLLSLIAVWSSELTEKAEDKKDPGEIVIDEVVGLSFTLFALPLTTNNILLGFTLFRLIDILKPQPIRLVEKTFPGGFGVVSDDIVAGITSNLIIRYFITFGY